ncbi:MAG: hypothetical protein K8U03_00435 [Planctomycetia bacterium]|nr:hypothetical protein [Planctomycetia bacterium]
MTRKEGEKLPQRTRLCRASGTSDNACDRRRAEHRDDVWSWGFVLDRTTSGRTLKWLLILVEHTRECLALKVDRGITSEDVIDALQNCSRRGACRNESVATTARSSSPTRSEAGSRKSTWGR